MENFRSIFKLLNQYPDEKSAMQCLATIRWKGNVTCPHCENEKTYKCAKCRCPYCAGSGCNECQYKGIIGWKR